jgi:phage FluMu protein Com
LIWTVIGSIGIVVATVVAGMLVDRRWSLLPRKEELQLAAGQRPLLPGHGEGEAPATAIAASIGEIERLRRKQKCPRCKLDLDSAADDAVTYDGHPLRVLRFACPRCAGIRSVYVREA